MLDINEDMWKIQQCYQKFKQNQPYYLIMDKYYFGNTKELKRSLHLPNRSNARIKTNFVQKLVDEEALYSFGNKITFKAIDESQKDAIKHIHYYLKNNGAGYDDSAGKRLVEFKLGYELSYINKKGIFKNKYFNPLEAEIWLDEYDEPEFFMYVHTKNLTIPPNKESKLYDYIDIYDDTYAYYFDYGLNFIEKKAHNMGDLPVGYAIVDNVRYTEQNGYIEGDKSIFRTIKTLQDAIEQNCSDITQEITDFHNAILKFYGIELEDQTDENGKVVEDSQGQPIKKEPLLGQNAILYFTDKQKEDAEWLIKNINDSFIKNTRDDFKDFIYTLTSHVDSNEKMVSNISGIALRSKLQSLEAKVKSNERAMEDIVRTRLKCLFNWLRLTTNGKLDFDENLIAIEFTPCVPQDIQMLSQIISQIPHDVVSNETKRGLLPFINNVDEEQERIDRENESLIPNMGLDNLDNTDSTKSMDKNKNMKNTTNNCC